MEANSNKFPIISQLNQISFPGTLVYRRNQFIKQTKRQIKAKKVY